MKGYLARTLGIGLVYRKSCGRTSAIMQLGFSGISRSTAARVRPIVNAAAAALIHPSLGGAIRFLLLRSSLVRTPASFLPSFLPSCCGKVRPPPPPRLSEWWWRTGAAPQKKMSFSFCLLVRYGHFSRERREGRQMQECDWEMKTSHLITSPRREQLLSLKWGPNGGRGRLCHDLVLSCRQACSSAVRPHRD